MTSRDLTCAETVAFVMDYLDGALPPAERAAFEAHLVVCADCVAYLRSYRETTALAKAHGRRDEDVAAEMPEDLVRAVLAAHRKG